MFRRTLPVLIATVSLAGCASSRVDLVPVPAGDSPMKISEAGVAMLQVQVQNQGVETSESSPVNVKFFLPNVVLTSAVQDGGPLEAGQSSAVLEFEIPEDCVDYGCEFQVYVDPQEDLDSEKRSNNLAQGHCEGRVVPVPAPAPEAPQPQVQ